MKSQWPQLVILTFAHVSADLFGGMLPAVLPVIRPAFGLSLTAAVGLITALNLSANGFQLVAGHAGAHHAKPRLLCAGLVLVALLALVGWVPAGDRAPWFLYPLMIAGGAGIALVHPDGLRAIHLLDRIPSSVSTAFFLVGGFLGFAAGAWLSAALVARWGLPGLAFMAAGPLAAVVLVLLARIRLAVEKDEAAAPPRGRLPSVAFPRLFTAAAAVAIAATLIPSLLPTRLHELGHSLQFGGASVLFFGIGGATGSVVWGAAAHRFGYLRILAVSLFGGVPLLIAYLAACAHPAAVVLLAAAGFFLYAAYPLMVTMARYSPSRIKLGLRMGLMVGGAWGIASLVLMGLGPAGERYGIAPVLHLAWIAYLVAAFYTLDSIRAAAPEPAAGG